MKESLSSPDASSSAHSWIAMGISSARRSSRRALRASSATGARLRYSLTRSQPLQRVLEGRQAGLYDGIAVSTGNNARLQVSMQRLSPHALHVASGVYSRAPILRSPKTPGSHRRRGWRTRSEERHSHAGHVRGAPCRDQVDEI